MRKRPLIEDIERKYDQGNEHGIMDQYIINIRSADKAERAAKKSNVIAWLSLWVGALGTIAASIALFQ